ncbi:unnamed protein product [Parnassius mnemosyne]|uniref:RAP domain-containing protein n=1 Tax=Parnassius mnemosyne TaxID=213953 RepID=A0AAV1M3N9_9NEOP
MSLVLRRSYSLKFRKNVQICNKCNSWPVGVFIISKRSFNDDKVNDHGFSSSSIIMENGYNVQELPILIRKLKDISDFEKIPKVESPQSTGDSHNNYHVIQAEFKQCMDLRDVFLLISRCTKITPSIALGAIERIYDLENNPTALVIDNDIKNDYISVAKGAILNKLLKIVMKTEDTYTILNILKTVSSVIEPYKHNFCEELLARVVDNKLTLNQLCDFMSYLIANNNDPKYSELADKLWVGFIERENEINENNIVHIFKILPGLKSSRRTIFVLLEQKLSDIWYKIRAPCMQEILEIFLREKCFSLQSFAVVGTWLNMNIHALDEDTLLDIITKLTTLNYTDNHVEKAVEKYMRHKSAKITSHVLIVGILKYCMQFQIRNEYILNGCGQFLLKNKDYIPTSFLKCFIYPFGYLNFYPNCYEFWTAVEETLVEKFEKMNIDDLSLIVLSFIYAGKYPLQLVNKMFTSEYLARINKHEIMRRLNLIDTALSLECQEYPGPLLPKDHWLQPVTQDKRIKNMLDKINGIFSSIVEDSMKVSNAVMIPNFCSDQTYLIDVMLHESEIGQNLCNWKLKSMKNKFIAILVHLPDHYCCDNSTLIGPQTLRIKHLRMLGIKVVSLKYSKLSQLYTSHDKPALIKYLKDSIGNALPCL